jgi:nicotinamidase/pyrazinamidase
MNTFSKYTRKSVGSLFHPRVDEAMYEGRMANLPDFTTDSKQVMLLLVDPQVGFIHEGRPLCVPGAIEDTVRTCEWIYKNIAQFGYVAISLDSHLPFQIFFPSWFCKEDGSPLDPFTSITIGDIGKTVFSVYDLPEYAYAPGKKMSWNEFYTMELAKNVGKFTKKDLMVWPYHTMLGTPEHAVDPTLMEAIFYHSAARSSQPLFLVKGNVPWTENYSVLEPEVKFPGHQNGGLNKEALKKMEDHDLIYIAGQAKSHCVYETIVSIVKFFGSKAPEVLNRVRILEDCMSPVGGYEDMATQAFADLKKQYGLKMVKSTDPIG